MATTKVKVEWDLDGLTLEAAGVNRVVEVPNALYLRGNNDVSEYLSDRYGWLVLGWRDVSKEEENEDNTQR